MRILQITDAVPPAILGGAGRIALDTARGLAKRGHEVTLLTAAVPGTLPLAQDGVRIVTIPPRSLRFAHVRSVHSNARAREVLRVIDSVKPDLIHAHTVAWQCGYGWMCKAAHRGIPCMFTAHDAMTVAYGKVTGGEACLPWSNLLHAKWTFNPFRNTVIRWAMRSCAVRLSVSDALKRFVEDHGLPAFQTLHNGIDTAFWHAADTQRSAREKLALPPDAPIFLLAGRIGVDKGSDVLLHAIPHDAHLLVAGSADPQAFAALGQRLHFFPHQTPQAMRSLYAACDAVVVPSLYLDPFPTVCLEAMACEKPVVATCFGGAKEAVADGVTGWIVDPRSQAFADRLLWCARNRSQLPAIGTRGRAHVRQHFEQNNYLEALETLYHSCSCASSS